MTINLKNSENRWYADADPVWADVGMKPFALSTLILGLFFIRLALRRFKELEIRPISGGGYLGGAGV